MYWSVSNIWNKTLDRGDERVYEKRDYMWASELYKSDIDIILNLRGEEQSNKPNARSFRKFEAGNIWEWIIKLILIKMGIFKSSQERVRCNFDNRYIDISGKIDFIAGGIINKDAMKDIDSLDLPEFFKKASQAIIDYLIANYPDGLDEKIVEVKSVSSFAFDRIENTGKALNGHDLQAFHYAHNKQMLASIVYICRDDVRMFEVPILPNDQKLLDKYNEKRKRISEYLEKDIMPEKEPLIIYDDEDKRFSKNFNVEYSSYLTKLYGFKEPSEYSDLFTPKIMSFNRVLKRVQEGKKMTPLNLEALEEMKNYQIDITKLQ